MAIKQWIVRGMLPILVAAVAIASFDAAHATGKKGKHAKTSATHTSAPSNAPTQYGPPDPGVYK